MTLDHSSEARPPAPIRFGMIGCGALGVVHTQRLTELPNVAVTAVSDPDPAAMARAADAAGSPAPSRHANYQDLLAEPGLDAVCISSPNPWHVEQILASLERGLDVLCEKPLSMEPAEVRRVVEATRASGRTVAIAYQSRYRRDSRILRHALRSGRWGQVTSANIFASENWITPNLGTWRHDPARCPGGYFGDANGHQLDLLFWLTGLTPEWVRATMERRGTPVPMVTWGEARLGRSERAGGESGVPLTFLFAGDAKLWREEISIQTEGADFVLRDTRLLWSDGSAALTSLDADTLPELASIGSDTPDTAFVSALRGGPAVASPPETVWPVLSFTLAALRSAANNSAQVRAVIDKEKE